MGAEPSSVEQRTSTRSWWPWLAVWLAVAAVLVWPLQVGVRMLIPVEVDSAALVPGLLDAIPLCVGVWLASRRDVRRARLGLALVASWAALRYLSQLMGLLATLSEFDSALSVGLKLLPLVLGAAALAAALLALRTFPGGVALGAVGRRKLGAVAVVVWAAAGPGLSGVTGMGQSSPLSALPMSGSATLELAFVPVWLIIAAVVWRHDDIAGVVPVAVIAVGALLSVPATVFRPGRTEMGVQALGADMTAWVRLAAAGVLFAAAVMLVVAARRAWRVQASVNGSPRVPGSLDE